MSENDIILIEKFINIRNKGYYCSGNEVTEVYNRVLNKNLRPSNCSSCIRQRINELEVALNAYKKAQEASNNADPIATPSEGKEAIVEPTESENKPIRKAGRPKRK